MAAKVQQKCPNERSSRVKNGSGNVYVDVQGRGGEMHGDEQGSK